MKDRIRQIMESRHMTQQVFAQYIELSPASLSSIFSGRTRPTLNVVEAIKKKIPDISTEWLLFGTGEMFQQNPADSTVAYPSSGNPQEPMLSFDPSVSSGNGSSISSPIGGPTPVSKASEFAYLQSTRPPYGNTARMEAQNIEKSSRKVIEIRVFYDDQTWDTFVPQKK